MGTRLMIPLLIFVPAGICQQTTGAAASWYAPPLPDTVIRNISIIPDSASGHPILTLENSGTLTITAVAVCNSNPPEAHGHTMSWDYANRPYAPGEKIEFGAVWTNSDSKNTYPCAVIFSDGTHLGDPPEEGGVRVLQQIIDRRKGLAQGLAQWQAKLAALPSDDAAAIDAFNSMASGVKRRTGETQQLDGPPSLVALGLEEADQEMLWQSSKITDALAAGKSKKEIRQDLIDRAIRDRVALTARAAEVK